MIELISRGAAFAILSMLLLRSGQIKMESSIKMPPLLLSLMGVSIANDKALLYGILGGRHFGTKSCDEMGSNFFSGPIGSFELIHRPGHIFVGQLIPRV